jgi:hypothetical protein
MYCPAPYALSHSVWVRQAEQVLSLGQQRPVPSIPLVQSLSERQRRQRPEGLLQATPSPAAVHSWSLSQRVHDPVPLHFPVPSGTPAQSASTLHWLQMATRQPVGHPPVITINGTQRGYLGFVHSASVLQVPQVPVFGPQWGARGR